MIKSKDVKIIKELVTSALFEVTKNIQKTFEIRPTIEKAFDIVIKEMKKGQI